MQKTFLYSFLGLSIGASFGLLARSCSDFKKPEKYPTIIIDGCHYIEVREIENGVEKVRNIVHKTNCPNHK